MKRKIAVFAYQINSLHIYKSPVMNSYDIYYFAEKGTPVANWIQTCIPITNILFYQTHNKSSSFRAKNLEDIAVTTDLQNILEANRITYIFTTEYISKYLQQWSKKTDITFISTSFDHQNTLENKLWFDSFMKRIAIPHPPGKSINLRNGMPTISHKMVLQEINSWGSEGTFFIQNSKDVEVLIEKKRIKSDKDLLLRTFIEGKSYGVTLFIAPGIIVLSPIRLQCFYHDKALSQDFFTGIQWVPSSEYSPGFFEKLNTILELLGRSLYEMNFVGFANIDFIVDSEKNIFIIECNPRFSAANIHISFRRSLLHHLDYYSLLFDTIIKKRDYPITYTFLKIPDSSFNGSYYLNDFRLRAGAHHRIRNESAIGLYSSIDDKVNFQTSNVLQSEVNDFDFFYFSELRKKDILDEEIVTVYELVTFFPFFTNGGALRKTSIQTTKYFNY